MKHMSALLPSATLFDPGSGPGSRLPAGRQIPRLYDDAAETWWFSVIDIVQVLIQQQEFRSVRT